MKSLHLFAEIGGGILADAILGNEIVGAVEILPYCRTVLRQHQEDGFLPPFPVFEDVREFDYEMYVGKTDLVCGGFPCQDISAVGQGEGLEGRKSSLFYELVRICRVIQPKYIFLENSPYINARGLDTVLEEIASMGFDAEWSTLSAGKCGAPHMRDRWWCLCRRQDVLVEESKSDSIKIEQWWEACSRSKQTADSKMSRCEADVSSGLRSQSTLSCCNRGTGWWKTQPAVGRVVNEFPNQVDAIKGLGNAQVPVVAALAFYLLLRRFC